MKHLPYTAVAHDFRQAYQEPVIPLGSTAKLGVRIILAISVIAILLSVYWAVTAWTIEVDTSKIAEERKTTQRSQLLAKSQLGAMDKRKDKAEYLADWAILNVSRQELLMKILDAIPSGVQVEFVTLTLTEGVGAGEIVFSIDGAETDTSVARNRISDVIYEFGAKVVIQDNPSTRGTRVSQRLKVSYPTNLKRAK